MFLQRKTMKFTANYWNNIRRMKQEIETADAIVIGAGAGFPQRQDSLTAGNVLRNIFQTLSRNTVLAICIPADFFHLKRRKNTGRIGQDTFTSIAIWMLITEHIKGYLDL